MKPVLLMHYSWPFVADPATRWVWPNPQKYHSHFSSFAKAIGGKAFAYESSHYIGNYAGAALWRPPNAHPDVEQLTTLLLSIGSDDAMNDGPKVFEKMGSYHPKEPHWYFPLLGVDPLHQGKGLGSALLQHTLAVCDIKTISLPISNHQTRRTFHFTNGMDLDCLAQSGKHVTTHLSDAS